MSQNIHIYLKYDTNDASHLAVTEFDDFGTDSFFSLLLPFWKYFSKFFLTVKFKGCTTGEHTSEKLQAPKPAIAPESCLNNFASSAAATSATVTSTPTPPIPQSDIPPEPERNPTTKEKPSELQEDPSGVEIPVGSRCKRSACSVVYAAGMPRTDDECCHHPGQSIFHEGSKGYSMLLTHWIPNLVHVFINFCCLIVIKNNLN